MILLWWRSGSSPPPPPPAPTGGGGPKPPKRRYVLDVDHRTQAPAPTDPPPIHERPTALDTRSIFERVAQKLGWQPDPSWALELPPLPISSPKAVYQWIASRRRAAQRQQRVQPKPPEPPTQEEILLIGETDEVLGVIRELMDVMGW